MGLYAWFGILVFLCISGNIRQNDHKPSTFGAYNTHLTPKAKVIKALMTQVKETRPKGAKVDHFKSTRQNWVESSLLEHQKDLH